MRQDAHKGGRSGRWSDCCSHLEQCVAAEMLEIVTCGCGDPVRTQRPQPCKRTQSPRLTFLHRVLWVTQMTCVSLFSCTAITKHQGVPLFHEPCHQCNPDPVRARRRRRLLARVRFSSSLLLQVVLSPRLILWRFLLAFPRSGKRLLPRRRDCRLPTFRRHGPHPVNHVSVRPVVCKRVCRLA